ncbi:hypothetical protein Lser_V15G26792 [Lactuca serriola]
MILEHSYGDGQRWLRGRSVNDAYNCYGGSRERRCSPHHRSRRTSLF